MGNNHKKFPHWAHHLLHHFLVALVIGSIIVLLEAHGYLNWLESTTLRVVTTLQSESQTSKNSDVRSFLIGDTYYEHEFKQATPLDRRELTRVIASILEKKPSVLAIDLDLSPLPGELNNEAQKNLESVLAQADVRDQKIPVVVIAPFPVLSEALLDEKYEWMSRMCRLGVHFAYPNLVVSMGFVMRYQPAIPTLGIVARRVISNEPSEPNNELCSHIANGMEHAAFLSKLFPFREALDATRFASQRPINQKYLASESSKGIEIDKLDDISAIPSLSRQAVFLGAEYNEPDHFQTAFGLRAGTDIHAAVYYSEGKPTTPLEHWLALIIDIAFGILAGYLFTWLWERANSAASKRVTNPTSMRYWLLARGWQFAACATLLAWLAILFWMSSLLLANNHWGNPGPLIIGVFAKTLIASRHGLLGHSPANSSHSPSLTQKIVVNLDWLLLSPIVVWAMFTVFHH